MSIQTSEIRLKVNDKSIHAHLASSVKGGSGILVLPSWWGLNPFFKQVCNQLAEQGYTVLAPDYYHGRVGKTIDEAKALQEEVEGDLEMMSAMIKASKDHLASLQKGKSIAIIGFSMGTDWAVMTAAEESDVAATILFYGGWSPDFNKMKSRVLGHYAGTDEWFPFDKAKDMEQKMKAAGVDATIYLYRGVAHWFMETDRPEYDPKAAELAWERTFEFLKQNLK